MNKQPFVFNLLPNAGLGNKMLVWARGAVFAHLNGLEYVNSSWFTFQLGVWLRNEKHKRMYFQYFNESPFLKRLMGKRVASTKTGLKNPELKLYQNLHQSVLFTKDAIGAELFAPLFPYQKFIKEELYKMLHPRIMKQLEATPPPEFAIHIRKGDFKISNQDTPIEYYVDLLKEIRHQENMDIDVTIFSDATDTELLPILQMKNVKRAWPLSDITGLLQMSRAKYFIMSRSSTFSYWAAFLGNGIAIRHAGDWQKLIKPDSKKIYNSNEILSNGLALAKMQRLP